MLIADANMNRSGFAKLKKEEGSKVYQYAVRKVMSKTKSLIPVRKAGECESSRERTGISKP
jgi:hypothetical protein